MSSEEDVPAPSPSAAVVARRASRERRVASKNQCIAPRWRSLMWSAQSQAEGLTLLVAENKTGYFGVYLINPGRPKPYVAQLKRGGKKVNLGSFATAEEAAVCVARSPEGQAAAAQRTAAEPPPLTSEEARQQVQAEGLTLRVAENTTGYFCVHHQSGRPKPYQARVRRGGEVVQLGSFATAEEAALCFARSPEGQAVVAERAAAAPPLTSEEARQQAQAEGLTLHVADSKAGYFGVSLANPGKTKPYKAQVSRDGKKVSLGSFATAEEAALCIARSPEGQAAAQKAAAVTRPVTSEEQRKGPFAKEQGVVPPMPPDAYVK
eukprot:scaffold73239_cov63-Phaeocystis_antarctica.AAC.1